MQVGNSDQIVHHLSLETAGYYVFPYVQAQLNIWNIYALVSLSNETSNLILRLKM